MIITDEDRFEADQRRLDRLAAIAAGVAAAYLREIPPRDDEAERKIAYRIAKLSRDIHDHLE